MEESSGIMLLLRESHLEEYEYATTVKSREIYLSRW